MVVAGGWGQVQAVATGWSNWSNELSINAAQAQVAAQAQAQHRSSDGVRAHLVACRAGHPAAAAGGERPQQGPTRVDNLKGATPQICLPKGHLGCHERVAGLPNARCIRPAAAQLLQQLAPSSAHRPALAAAARLPAEQPGQQTRSAGCRYGGASRSASFQGGGSPVEASWAHRHRREGPLAAASQAAGARHR